MCGLTEMGSEKLKIIVRIIMGELLVWRGLNYCLGAAMIVLLKLWCRAFEFLTHDLCLFFLPSFFLSFLYFLNYIRQINS